MAMVSVVICGSGGWGCSMVVGVGSREVGWGVQVTVSSGFRNYWKEWR